MTQEYKNTQEYYTTTDLALATAISLYYPIESIDRTNPIKAQFLFIRDESLDQFIEAFWRKELTIEPQSYFVQLKVIKSRLYEER